MNPLNRRSSRPVAGSQTRIMSVLLPVTKELPSGENRNVGGPTESAAMDLSASRSHKVTFFESGSRNANLLPSGENTWPTPPGADCFDNLPFATSQIQTLPLIVLVSAMGTMSGLAETSFLPSAEKARLCT